MMRRAPPNGDRQEAILRRLERGAVILNPILIIIVAGWAMLDVSVFLALQLPLEVTPARVMLEPSLGVKTVLPPL